MQKRPDAPGWFAWYCLRRTDFQSVESPASLNELVRKDKTRQIENLSYDTLIGGLGFLGPPNAVGETAVGYSLLANHHRQGFCPEALTALLDWAFTHADLKTLVIRTPRQHRPSIRVAEKLRFEFAGPGPAQGTVEYVLCREVWAKAIPKCDE
jgi:RimJ/RimL family protein N-acetyltransferase